MERIRLDIIPKGLMPVCHASQYDAGRVIRLDLMDGLQGYSLTNEEIELNVRKPDGHIVTASVDVVEGQTYVDIVTTEQMCAVEGENICELKISKDDAEIYSLNFKMMVEKSVTEGGDPSESFIHNLHTQIAEGVAEEVATQYDSANVIFDNVPTENHGIGYTVTSEGIKTAIDNAFDYDNTASGSLVHIEDGAENIPVKSLISQIVAVESGSGEKSPTNPYTISGFDSGVVPVCGVNIFDEEMEVGTLNNSTGATETDVNKMRSVNFISVKPNTTYSVFNATGVNLYIYSYGVDKSFIDFDNTGMVTGSTFTTDSNTHYIKFRTQNNPSYSNNISINYPSSDTEYHAYNGTTYTFAFGQTVYGGHFDNKGNLVVTHYFVDLGSLTYGMGTGGNARFTASLPLTPIAPQSATNIGDITSDIYTTTSSSDIYGGSGNYLVAIHTNGLLWIRNTDYSDVNTFKTAMSGHCVVYELANPITLTITSQDIPTLLGENNIFSNCGDVEVNYYTNKANDILEFVDSEIGKKNGTNIPIEENSQDSIKDYVDDEISSTKDYVDNGLNDKVAYKSGEVVYSNYVTGAYVSGSGNYVEFCIPINTKAASGTITNLGTTLNVFVGNTRLTNEVTLSDSSVVAIKDGYAQIELKLNSTQTANSVATVSLDGFTVNFE